mmetsp:Transcript_3649/g.3741  ORF Transcript_3649/g.3741 Transcript_3649/m.3741 type:complete len:99 (+) Transcript_3649:81-377(+)
MNKYRIWLLCLYVTKTHSTIHRQEILLSSSTSNLSHDFENNIGNATRALVVSRFFSPKGHDIKRILKKKSSEINIIKCTILSIDYNASFLSSFNKSST